jgi:uncharacterized protein YdeI (YjbR/CyaY-like superfamily)
MKDSVKVSMTATGTEFLAMEGQLEPSPILRAAFQSHPLARQGWEAMTPIRRRNHLLAIFHYQSAQGRERRARRAVEDRPQDRETI